MSRIDTAYIRMYVLCVIWFFLQHLWKSYDTLPVNIRGGRR